MMRILAILSGVLLSAVLSATPATQTWAGGSQSPCNAQADLNTASAECELTAEDVMNEQEAEEESAYTFFQQCSSGTSGEAEVCANPRTCEGDPPGTWYVVYVDGIRVGRVCLSAAQSQQVRVDLASVVTRKFKQLSWPPSELTIQPPKGRTLVNLDTIFFTTNAEATVVPVRLLGQSVEIEATPTSYTWHFGDGESLTTETPGHAYPDQDVTHTYFQTATVAPSVDTTYSGRYRVGDGGWLTIDATVTEPGAPQQLTIVEAKPKLVR